MTKSEATRGSDAKRGADAASAQAPGDERRENEGLGVRSPVSYRSHPTAQKILAAAKTLLTERGYRGMTLQAISTEAKVNKAAAWYYFGGKQQLLDALLEDLLITESHHYGILPPADATLAERVDLIVGSAAQVNDRVRRFAAFYELLPEASRDVDLHRHLQALYQSWYEWATAVLTPPETGARETGPKQTGPAKAGFKQDDEQEGTLGQFASILLDGIFLQMVVAAPEFNLERALARARSALLHLIGEEFGELGATRPA